MSGVDAFGTQLKRGDGGAPEVFAAIAAITDLSGPSLERKTYDTTAHDSVTPYEEHIGGLRSAGEVSATINYDPSVHNTLLGDFEDLVPRSYQMVFPDSPPSTCAFKATLTGFEPSAPHDDKLTAKVKLKISGKPTWS